jgi:UDP-2-acetamido-2,6-beta-L-arabino-hexul-4-ose reductase
VRVVVTGAHGFIGRHVMALLRYEPDAVAVGIGRGTSRDELERELSTSDAVIHLAGVNRPDDEREFATGNAGLTESVVGMLLGSGRSPAFLLSSSSRALDESPYGRSKLGAEEAVVRYHEQSGAPVAIYRLPNVFGKWSRPFYNSAVATFCHGVARDVPFEVHDPASSVRLVYGEDVARSMVERALRPTPESREDVYPAVRPEYERTLGEIVALLQQFRRLRTELLVPDLSDDFVRKLYGTYVSFLAAADVGYPLAQFSDERGSLAELLKSPWFGQVFISRTRPGITRGNHFHHTKTEKFVVVEGAAVVRMRSADGSEVSETRVDGRDFMVVDIPTGSTHSITNVGESELVTLFWASEIFDRARPDTYPLDVQEDP